MNYSLLPIIVCIYNWRHLLLPKTLPTAKTLAGDQLPIMLQIPKLFLNPPEKPAPKKRGFQIKKTDNKHFFKLREGASISRFVCLSVPRSVGRSVGRSVRRNFFKTLDLAKFINICGSKIVWVATYIPYSYQASGKSFYDLVCLSVCQSVCQWTIFYYSETTIEGSIS